MNTHYWCRVDGDEGWRQEVDSLEETLTSLGLEVGFNAKYKGYYSVHVFRRIKSILSCLSLSPGFH